MRRDKTRKGTTMNGRVEKMMATASTPGTSVSSCSDGESGGPAGPEVEDIYGILSKQAAIRASHSRRGSE